MIVYGRNSVREALRGRRAHAVAEVMATASVADDPWLRSTTVRISEAAEIERACGSAEHQGVCAEVGPYPYAGASELLTGPDPLVLVLDEVTDPHNLGAVCRTAECVGASGVVVPERRAADVSPSVCRASAGAVEHLRVARVRNIADFLEEAKRAGSWCYGAAATEDAVPYDQVDWRGGVVLVLGSEGRGLRRRVADTCDALVALPMRGQIASLNVSAAAAVLSYEALRVRAALDKAP